MGSFSSSTEECLPLKWEVGSVFGAPDLNIPIKILEYCHCFQVRYLKEISFSYDNLGLEKKLSLSWNLVSTDHIGLMIRHLGVHLFALGNAVAINYLRKSQNE